MKRARVTVLLSGGIDSAATLAFYKKRRALLDAVFVDYGQPARASEWDAAQALAARLRVPVARVSLGFTPSVDKGEYFGRNALLAFAAVANSTKPPAILALGLHTGCPYYDTKPEFLDDMQRLLDGYSNGLITIAAPFLENSKADIVHVARRLRVPLSLTYSCERRSSPPCGECLSCADRGAANVD
jgi:7-cyano-7-deazaguanine synthase